MKPRHANKLTAALTRTEVLVVVVIIAVLAAVFLPALRINRPPRSYQLFCVNNMRQVGLAFRQWSVDNNDKFPMQVSVTNGGTMELVEKGFAYVHFQALSNELASPKIFVCPQDVERRAETKFTADFNDSHVSYFVGVDADQTKPTMFLAGDANLEVGGVPAKHGLLKLWTNSPVAWNKPRHNPGGFIAFADGHVECLKTEWLRAALTETGVATNRLAIP